MRTRRSKINETKEEEVKVEDIRSELTSPLKKRRSRMKSNEFDNKDLNLIPDSLTANNKDLSVNNMEVHVEKATIESESTSINVECNVNELNPEITEHELYNDSNLLQNQDSNADFLINEDTPNDLLINNKLLSPSEDIIKINSIVDIVPCEEDFLPNFEGDEEFEPEDTQKSKSNILNEEFKIDIGLSSDIDTINIIPDENNLNNKDEIISIQKEHTLDTTENKFIPSSIIHVLNLVRPFTLRQLKELFKKFGDFDEDNDLWIDKIKSHCIIKFKEDVSAAEAIKELDGQKWPTSNPKMLKVEFSDQETLDRYKQSDASLTPQTEFRKSISSTGNEGKIVGGTTGVETNVLAEIDNHNTSRTSIDSQQGFMCDKSTASGHQHVLWNPDPFASIPSRKIAIKGEAVESIDKSKDSVWADHADKPYNLHGDQSTRPHARGDHFKVGDNHIFDRSAIRREDSHAAPLHQAKIAHVKEWDKDKVVVDYQTNPSNESHSSNYAAPAKDAKEDKAPNKSGQLMDELFSKTHTLPCVYWLPLTVKQMEAKVKELGVAYVYEKDIIKMSHSCKTYQSHPYENIEALRRKQDAFMPPPPVQAPYHDDPYSNAPYPPGPYNEPKWAEPYDRKDKWGQGDDVASHNPFPMMRPRDTSFKAAPLDFDPSYQPRNFLSRDYDYSRRRQQRPPPYGVAEPSYPPPHGNPEKRDFEDFSALDGTLERSGPFHKKSRYDEYQHASATRHRDFDSRGDSRSFKRDVSSRAKYMGDKEPSDRGVKDNMKRSRGESRERRSHRR